MVLDSGEVYLDYCSVSTWWDQCKNAGHVHENKAQLGEDFVIENVGYSFHVHSHGHELFKFIQSNSAKIEVSFYITALCTAKQFDVIYKAFMHQISEAYTELAEDASIKEMVDEPNSIELVNTLVKKYGHSPQESGDLEAEN